MFTVFEVDNTNNANAWASDCLSSLFVDVAEDRRTELSDPVEKIQFLCDIAWMTGRNWCALSDRAHEYAVWSAYCFKPYKAEALCKYHGWPVADDEQTMFELVTTKLHDALTAAAIRFCRDQLDLP